MSATEEPVAEHKPERAPSRDAPEDEPAERESWHKRLKLKLASKIGDLLAATIARLQALKARFPGADDESEERPRAKPAHPAPPPEAAAPTAATAAQPHRLRNVAILAGLVLASCALGAGGAYSLLSRLLKDQSLAIEGHEQEIRTFQLEDQEKGKKLAEVLRQLEAEQKLRTEMEMRLVEAEQKRLVAEAAASMPKAEVARQEPAALPGPAARAEPAPETKPSGRPSRASSFGPPGSGNCSLAGSDPTALRRCIDAYNRK